MKKILQTESGAVNSMILLYWIIEILGVLTVGLVLLWVVVFLMLKINGLVRGGK